MSLSVDDRRPRSELVESVLDFNPTIFTADQFAEQIAEAEKISTEAAADLKATGRACVYAFGKQADSIRRCILALTKSGNLDDVADLAQDAYDNKGKGKPDVDGVAYNRIRVAAAAGGKDYNPPIALQSDKKTEIVRWAVVVKKAPKALETRVHELLVDKKGALKVEPDELAEVLELVVGYTGPQRLEDEKLRISKEQIAQETVGIREAAQKLVDVATGETGIAVQECTNLRHELKTAHAKITELEEALQKRSDQLVSAENALKNAQAKQKKNRK